MSLEAKRWWERAQEINFHQLDSARKQAEAWRTGLAGSTALIGAVLVAKGPDNLARVALGFRILIVGLLAAGLASFATATFLAIGAAAGAPGVRVLLTGEELRAWSGREVEVIGRALKWAARLTAVGVAAVGLAVCLTWLLPQQQVASLVRVESMSEHLCGRLVGGDDHSIVIEPDQSETVYVISYSDILLIRSVSSC